MKNITPEPQSPNLPTMVSTAINAVNGDLKITLETAFVAMARQAQDWMSKAREIVVRDEHDQESMQQARVFRLELRQVRIDAKKKHGELKAPILGYSQAIDACERMIRQACEPAEALLLDREEYVERQAARQRQARAAARAEELRVLGVDPALYLTQADQFTPEQWVEFRQGQQDAISARKEREVREAEDRRKREVEAENLRKENERLRAEKAKLEVVAQDLHVNSRKLEDDLARQQRLAKLAVPAPVQRSVPAGATDAARLDQYLADIQALPLPPMTTEAGGRALQHIVATLGRLGDEVAVMVRDTNA